MGDWKNDPATAKQLDALRFRGLTENLPTTKGEASKLLFRVKSFDEEFKELWDFGSTDTDGAVSDASCSKKTGLRMPKRS